MRLCLLIDADDTLWENSVYFERAIAEFIDYLDHPSLSPRAVREALDSIEAANIKKNGYGADNFTRNLGQCFSRLHGRRCESHELRRLSDMTDAG